MSNNAPLRGNPIPPAEINHDPAHGRVGPMIQLPIPKNRDGRPDYNRAPGLDLSRIVPVGSLNTNPPPTEGIEGTPSFSGGNEKKNKSIAAQLKEKKPQGQDGQDGQDDDEEEEEEDEGQISLETDARNATSLLSHKLPMELIPEILDEAEYFPHQILASVTEPQSVVDGQKVYLTARIPNFTALEKDTPGAGGKRGAGGRKGRVRRLVFRFKSYDQGWSSFGRDYGSFRACWSWLDVEVWRVREGEAEEGDEGGMYKVAESLLQRNRHAESDRTEYEVSWRWDEDMLGPEDEGKYEDGVVDENGEIQDGGWERGGRHERNGEFVRMLRGGDEVRVVIKALFPGWRCTVDRCEVECWWAV
ncbi:hypothetical protein TWF481_008513 [Arthrobotrys musiformis]|uniref:Uncharacterized protein n=1 Tax=Arthrobotrys musiformis TaxID=47236 RepID=A0AAV9W8V6_9PEZI